MEHGLVVNVVLGQRPDAILELLALEDQLLLIDGDAFSVLYFDLHVVDRLRAVNFDDHGLACWSFYMNLGLHRQMIVTKVKHRGEIDVAEPRKLSEG